jgi:hypothetical protein
MAKFIEYQYRDMRWGDGHALQPGPVVAGNTRRSLLWVQAEQFAP